jgi:hypothetical protein
MIHEALSNTSGISKELEDKCKSIVDKFTDENSEYDMVDLLRNMFSYDTGNAPRNWNALFYLKKHTIDRC